MDDPAAELEAMECSPAHLALSIPPIISKIFHHLDATSFLSCRLVNKQWNSNVEMVYPQHQETYFIVTRGSDGASFSLSSPSYSTFLTKRISFLNPSSLLTKVDRIIPFFEEWGENVESIHINLNYNKEKNLTKVLTDRNDFLPKFKELSLTISVEVFDSELEKELGKVSSKLMHLKLVGDDCFSSNIPVLPFLKSLTIIPRSYDSLKLDYESYGGFVGFLKVKFPSLASLVLADRSKKYVPIRNYILASEIVKSTEKNEKLKMLFIPRPVNDKYIGKIKEKFPNLKSFKTIDCRRYE